MIANILPIYPSQNLGSSQKVKIQLFLEYGHAAYQIKGNDKCSNMKAHILSLHTLDPWGGGQRFFFSESGHVAYQINWN